jgi:hypothetical protein
MNERIPIRHSRYRLGTGDEKRRRPLLRSGKMALHGLWLTVGLATAFALFKSGAYAEKRTEPGITPVQAELMADVNARLLKVGETVYARVTDVWQGSDCLLKTGAILEGRVISVTPYRENDKISQIDLAFTGAQCGDPKMGAFELLLAALAAPPQNSDLGVMTAPLPLSTAAGPGGLASFKMMQLSGIINLQLDTQVYRAPDLPHMRMGTVSGIRGLKLDVAAGPERSSVLTSKGHDVSLEKHTVLLLVSAKGIFPQAPANPEAAPPTVASVTGDHTSLIDAPVGAPAQPPADEIESCAPPQCNVALAPGTAIDGTKPEATISIRKLGFASRPQEERLAFNQDDVLAYLGSKQLLITFNPHILIRRHSLGRSGFIVRVIRAALVNTETHLVTRIVDWELPDNREFIWPLTGGRILVHVGSELRVYGEGLKVLNRIPLEGPLYFVRVTPDGSFVALGLAHERHSPELHAQLLASLNREPEEDVNVVVLNRNFETIAKSSTTSGLVPPTLLDEGQARLLAQPNMRYRLAMLTWDNHASTLARFNSSCTPKFSSLTPDLIFLESCDMHTHALQYRVLRSNGKLALKGNSNPNYFDLAAAGSPNREAFVVKSIQTSSFLNQGDPFNATDLSSEDLQVYRAADGKRLLRVSISSPSMSHDNYALAPDGSELAVLTGDQIAIYSVAKN